MKVAKKAIKMPSSNAISVGTQSLEIEVRTPDECMSGASSDAGTSEHHDKSTNSASEHGDDNHIEDDDIPIMDPNCVAEKPYRITFQDITSAAFMIKSGIECTPCTVCSWL